MLTVFSPESIIKRTLDELEISADVFAYLSGKSQSRLSQALRGIKPFAGNESETLLHLITELREAYADAKPYRLPIEPAALKSLLDDRRNTKLRQKREIVSIRLNNRGWFQYRNANGALSAVLNIFMAAALEKTVAEEIGRRLTKQGYTISLHANPYRDVEPIGIDAVWSE